MKSEEKNMVGNLIGFALVVVISGWLYITALPISSAISTMILLNIHSIVCFFVGLVIIFVVWVMFVFVVSLIVDV